MTARGTGLLVFGALLLGAGLFVGERTLVAAAVLLLALPPLSLLSLAGVGRLLVHSRTLRPSRVAAGSQALVMVRVANAGAVRPVGGVLAEDALAPGLGEAPRFRVGLLPPRGAHDMAYRVTAARRGLHTVGPLRVTVADPLGCARVRRTLGGPEALLVTPRLVALGPDGPHGGAAELGESPARSMAAGGEDDPVPRPYQRGDDLRRVHWRSTARHGALMVRREEAHHAEDADVLVDMRAAGSSDPGAETAVAAAASVAVHLQARGRRVRVATGAGRIAEADGAHGGAARLVEALALAPEAAPGAVGPWALAGADPGGGPLVAVAGALGTADAAALAAVGGERERVAVLCAPDAPGAADAEAVLARSGWRVLRVRTLDDLPAAWAALPAATGGLR
ncbi:DUF58 domain-containing protein [Nocardiopsis suaedae]|uniref:DUF58 domain-containing protein n=1 Tax=Nocardiopsis suaedae TaxID=3018444 RepID=A0ABT4TUC1_9ACTN|nr:DUF58 domain-containing protein [Nocardiopsis suaedae]MDA2808237.1 DUF58 domain-containing protein [Nocardiopsis suaedae]